LLKNKELVKNEANRGSASKSISWKLAKKAKLKLATGEGELMIDD
jgi:hypothetical protein